jgi:putative oxidoreductase
MLNPDFGMLVLRVVIGLLICGHGSQKLFAWFGGKGLAGTTKMMENLGIRPTGFWAIVNALGEFLGGLGLAFGLLTPLAAAAVIGAMLTAIIKVHWPKGLWNSNGGFEFPLTIAIVAFVVGLVGPGVYSLDNVIGLSLPEPGVYVVLLLGMLVTVGAAILPTAHEERRAGRPV